MKHQPRYSPVSDAVIQRAIEVVSGGGIIIFPTDTVYGMGCDPSRSEAVRRIFKLKKRGDKPLPILASSLTAAREIAEFSGIAEELADEFWPGAVTLLLTRRSGKVEEATLGLPTVGVRVPGYEVPRSIAAGVGGLLVGTSANISGERSVASFGDIAPALVEGVDFAVVDAPCRMGQESTVIDASKSRPVVLREGAVSRKLVEMFLRRRR